MNLAEVYAGREYAISKVTSNLVIDGITPLTQGKIYRILYHSVINGSSAVFVKDDTGGEVAWLASQFQMFQNPRRSNKYLFSVRL